MSFITGLCVNNIAIEKTEGMRKCKRCKTFMQTGVNCFVDYEDTYYGPRKCSYCIPCGEEQIDTIIKEVKRLKKILKEKK